LAIIAVMNEFPHAQALAAGLADFVETALTRRIDKDGHAALAVSGGTTPITFFDVLSRRTLNWSNVTVTLVDDRWVPEVSPRSNAALVRKYLLQGQAASANFVALVNGAATPEAGLPDAQAAIAALPLPFAAVVLGMGTDGHTASFFPGGDRLRQALSPMPGQRVETMRSAAAIEARITLTLPTLLEADHVLIHIEGLEKRRTLEAAFHPGPIIEMPIRAILGRDIAPDIFWSP